MLKMTSGKSVSRQVILYIIECMHRIMQFVAGESSTFSSPDFVVSSNVRSDKIPRLLHTHSFRMRVRESLFP